MKDVRDDANPKEDPLCDRYTRIRAIIRDIVESCKDEPELMASAMVEWLELVDISEERANAALQ